MVFGQKSVLFIWCPVYRAVLESVKKSIMYMYCVHVWSGNDVTGSNEYSNYVLSMFEGGNTA